MKIFSNEPELEEFFKRIGSEWIEEKVEYKLFDGYERTRVLIVAPHASRERVKVEIEGRKISLRVGDVNSDKLAKIAAYNIGGAYLISYVSRIHADFARRPDDLGKGLRLNYLYHGKRRSIRIHRDESYKPLLERFHELIEELKPRFILSFHGTVIKNFDALLGFGEERKFIGGRENAMMFKRLVLEKMKKYGIEAKIGVSKRFYLGRSEAILTMHVNEGRNGCLVEFSDKERVGFPSKRYQILATCIAEVARGWKT